MFSWFRSLKENWRLVKTFDINAYYVSDKGKLYYHLFESSKKRRKVEYVCTISVPHYHVRHVAENSTLYQEKIYRWIMGRYDPEIPRYDDIPEEDTVNALKGKI